MLSVTPAPIESAQCSTSKATFQNRQKRFSIVLEGWSASEADVFQFDFVWAYGHERFSKRDREKAE
eukprot:2996178-Amphidinium_carterae.1